MLLSKSVRNYCRFLLFSCSSGQPTSSAALPIRCHLLCQLSLLFLPNANQPEFPWLLTKQSFLNKQNKTHDGVDGPVDQTSQFNCTMHCTVLYCTVSTIDSTICLFSFCFLFVLFCFGFVLVLGFRLFLHVRFVPVLLSTVTSELMTSYFLKYFYKKL